MRASHGTLALFIDQHRAHNSLLPCSVRSSAYRSHHHTAAGMDVLARQPTRLFAHHKGYNVGDVLRRAKSLERRGLLAGLAEGGIGGEHGRVCGPRGDRVFRELLGGKFRWEAISVLFWGALASEANKVTGQADMGA